MACKLKPEEIIGKLRDAEIVLAQGGTVSNLTLDKLNLQEAARRNY